ncbi:hypothetical protein BDW22DRAFT_1364462 [Trametopsis cervina]|nr:hypothetical protein BDW22DRAFT_1364462 [Trametopsis cervina]
MTHRNIHRYSANGLPSHRPRATIPLPTRLSHPFTTPSWCMRSRSQTSAKRRNRSLVK